ncbi:hypothetical protein SAMN05414139_05461 [Burkholderia sp. D7]|nr:hypothetical protein SAMN05414139_05461 [Burkholderia sp. D7]
MPRKKFGAAFIATADQDAELIFKKLKSKKWEL